MSENSKRNKYLILILLVVILTFVVYLIISNVRNKTNKEIPLAPKIQVVEVVKKDTIKHKIETPKEDKKSKDDIVNNVPKAQLKHELYLKGNKIKKTPQEITETSSSSAPQSECYLNKKAISGGKYYVIVGSYKNKANANSLIKKLKKMGYANPIIFKSKGFYKISLGSYKTKKAAIKACNDAQAGEFPGAWVSAK